MPLYVGDYLADTRRLNTTEHGAYLLLIMDYWMNGPLPNDDNTLCRITACHPDAWKKLRPTLEQFFCLDGGKWHHKRIDRERAKTDAIADTYRKRASQAARQRWESHASSSPSSNAPRTASGIATSTPSSIVDDTKSGNENASSNASSIAQAMLGDASPPPPPPLHVQKTSTEEIAHMAPEPCASAKTMQTVDLMDDCIELLGRDEMNLRHRRWLKRAEAEPDKLSRVLAEIRRMQCEGVAFKASPGAAAEDLWKRFN